MSFFNLSGFILAFVALIGYINHRWVKLPDVIGMTAIGLLVSVFVAVEGRYVSPVHDMAMTIVSGINFTEIIFHGFLGLLLFAGSLHVDLSALKDQKLPVAMLSTIGVLISTAVVGVGSWALLSLLGMEISLSVCLLFGALISPTDPIAVQAILKKARVPESLETKIVGESLFNDGTAVVAFMSILAIIMSGTEPTVGQVSLMLLREVGGGILFGLAAGYLGHLVLRDVDNYQIEIIITLAMAVGGYALAEAVHVSAPLAVVVSGLVVGNHRVELTHTHQARTHLLIFWTLIDELLNLILFALVGIQVIVITFNTHQLLAGMIAIPLVLAARMLSIWLPLRLTNVSKRLSPHSIKVMTWGGLRGGISVALALSLPESIPGREIVISTTYIVVVFSLLIQATTLGVFMRRLGLGRPQD